MQTNPQKHRNPLVTHEGAPARRGVQAAEQLRRSLSACLLWEKEFYEEGEQIADRIHSAAAGCTPEFVAHLAIDARKNMGLRHAPLWLAMHLIERGTSNATATLAAVISRPDELCEALAMWWRDGRRPLTNPLRKGLAQAFGKFDVYQLAKYNRDREVKLRDVMFLCHPKPRNEAQAQAFKALADKTLSPPDTWEVALSAGKDKRETFERLIKQRKLGYLALLRNLRNMRDAGVDRELAVNALRTGKTKGVLPFQFIAAARACPDLEPTLDEMMQHALVQSEMHLSGATTLLIDVSDSMNVPLSNRASLTRMDAACALAMLVAGISHDLRVYTFSNSVVEVPPRRGMALGDAIVNSQSHGGTYLGRATAEIDNPNRRLIVFTDEQSHDVVPNPQGVGYMVNVASYENGVGYGAWRHINGFSERVINYIVDVEMEGLV